MNEQRVSWGPPPTELLKTGALARLRQSLWEAHQHVSTKEIDAYVQGVLREIDDDAP